MKILCAVGTRPEAIKMAPVIKELSSNDSFDCRVLATAQHREMLDQVLEIFKITPDIDLDIMQPNQSLSTLTSRLLEKLDKVILDEQPDIILAQGDTTTVMTMALTAFYHKIPFGHVEAGLRTGDMMNPFPEEMNRVLASKMTKWHFAPTESSKQNLLKEGVRENDIYVTGNTVIDALMSVADSCPELGIKLNEEKRLILVTAHRRENFGEPFLNICEAILELSKRDDIEILFPVHPNPNVKTVAYKILGDQDNVKLCDPLDYLPFVSAMKKAYLILSDSGGVQEEAPALGKPVLVMRNTTERPEAVNAGVVELIGSEKKAILNSTKRLLDDQDAYKKMAKGVSPYGDGKAAMRISKILRKN